MKTAFAVLALLALMPATGHACSMVMSPKFHVLPNASAQQPPRIGVKKVDFVAWIGGPDVGSCEGVGFIAIELSGPSVRKIADYGILIEPQSGMNDERFFPATPLAPRKSYTGRAIEIRWAWTSLTPDADGKVRWHLNLIPVSRSGARGEPVPICVSSDDSCPQPTP
ncbi:hypothetical protein J5226_01605 [Lysobacter sp. K5869]|uniref:hypothetical protein n=1 Tax=Lysobacter sp. K5869 TaxID=2820808 RepID=UPI001C05FAAD|nr:hypothetical protein [Lysobacter sp. K5869]QWP77128.1 hypothetical protein J5226_01605 [Lysobacter sp. K5869]